MINNSPPDKLPDFEILQLIKEMVNYCDTPEMIKMEKEDFEGYKTHLENKFVKLCNEEYGIFYALLKVNERANKLTEILDMFELLGEVKLGKKTLKEIDEEYKERLLNRHIYEPNGGKEAFEKKILKKAAKKKK